MDSYLVIKTIHIISATVLFGTGMGIAFFHFVGQRSPDFAAKLFAARMCPGGVSWIMRHDHKALVNFVSAQSPIGEALYRHYGIVMDESYLLISDEQAYTASGG